MIIKKIELYNWMPYAGRQVINLENNDDPFVHIIGKYSRNTKESNGSGKSSILQAIYFCLYGKVQNAYMHKGADSMYVKLYFSDGTVIQKGTDGVWLNGEKTTNAILSAFVERMFNMDNKLFLYTHCILNGEIKGIFTLSPKEQKEILMSINEYNIDFEEFYSKSKEHLNALTKEDEAIQSKLEYIQEKLSLANIEDAKSALETAKNELKMREHELKQFNKNEDENLKQQNKLEKKIVDLKNKIYFTNTKIEEVNKHEERRKSIKEKIKELEEKASQYKSITAESNAVKALEKTIQEKKLRAKQLKKQIDAYKESGGNCPILNEECPKKDLLNVKAHSWNKEFKTLITEIKELMPQLEEATARRDTVSKINQELYALQQSLFTIPENNTTVEELEKQRNEYAEQLAKIEEEYNKLLQSFSSGFKESLLTDIDILKRRINVIETTMETYNQYQKEYEELDKKSAELQEKIKIAAIATKMLSPHGIPYYLSIQLLKKLENYTNDFLKHMETAVYISPYQELTSYESTCIVDGYKFKNGEMRCPKCGTKREKKINPQITVYSKDRGIKIDEESTGRKAIFYLALRFGLMKLLKTKGNIFIIDEVFANLDDVNKQRMLQMIAHAAEVLNLKQIFIVSNDELKEILPPDIIVVRKGNKSVIE